MVMRRDGCDHIEFCSTVSAFSVKFGRGIIVYNPKGGFKIASMVFKREHGVISIGIPLNL